MASGCFWGGVRAACGGSFRRVRSLSGFLDLARLLVLGFSVLFAVFCVAFFASRQVAPSGWAFTQDFEEGWMDLGHDTSNWTGINVPFLEVGRNSTAYYRGFVEVAGWVKPDVLIDGQSSIRRVYVNGVDAVCYIGMPVDVPELVALGSRNVEAVLDGGLFRPGRNLVAVEVKGGDYRAISIRGSGRVTAGGFLLFCFYALPFVLLLVLGRRFLASPVVALLVFFVASLVFVSPLFNGFNYWGGHDWDLSEGFFAVAKETFLRYHQLPLWNPYMTGGTPLLADPLSMALSPLMPLVLVLDVVAAIKLQLVVWYVIGLMGAYFLGRHWKFNVYALYLFAFAFMLSGFYSIHETEGHITLRSIPLLPWAFLFYLRSAEGGRLGYAALGGLMMAFMMFDGGIYACVYTAIVLFLYSVFSSAGMWVGRKSRGEWTRPLAVCCIVGLAFLVFGAVKALPLVELSREFSRFTDNDLTLYDGYTLGYLYYGLLGGIQRKYAPSEFADFRSNWHEFGVYVGPVVVFLSLAALLFYFRSVWPLALVLFCGLWLCWGTGRGEMVPLSLLHRLPVFASMRASSRLIVVALLPLTLLAGIMASRLEGRRVFVGWLLAVLVFYNLVYVASPTLGDAFIIAPRDARAGAFVQAGDDAQMMYVYSELYRHFLENRGVVDYGALRFLSGAGTNVLPVGNPNYRGESFLYGGGGSAFIEYFSTNRMRIRVDADREDTLVVNQNYESGWRAVGMEVFPVGGLIGVKVAPGEREVLLYYSPVSFKAGLFVTVFGVLIAFYWVVGGGGLLGMRRFALSLLTARWMFVAMLLALAVFYGVDFIQSGVLLP